MRRIVIIVTIAICLGFFNFRAFAVFTQTPKSLHLTDLRKCSISNAWLWVKQQSSNVGRKKYLSSAFVAKIRVNTYPIYVRKNIKHLNVYKFEATLERTIAGTEHNKNHFVVYAPSPYHPEKVVGELFFVVGYIWKNEVWLAPVTSYCLENMPKLVH